MAAIKSSGNSFIPAFLRDVRVIQIIGQVAFVIFVFVLLGTLSNTASRELAAKGLNPSFSFLDLRAGFAIAETPAWYTDDSTYGQALAVGMINMLRIVGLGLVLSTVLGIFVGIFLLSSNWLIRTISRVYVEILRNTPLLVQIFAWYFIVMFSFPPIREAITLPSEGVLFVSLRIALWIGVYFIVRRYTNPMPSDAPRRVAVMWGFFAALLVTEIAFYLFHNNPAWPLAYGSGVLSNLTFLLYAGVSAILIAAAALVVPENLRPLALGATIGQAIAGVLFYFGIMPNASLRLEMYPAVYMSIRGFAFPEILPGARFVEWAALVLISVVVTVFMWRQAGREMEQRGKVIPRMRYAGIILLLGVVGGWFLVGIEPAAETVLVTVDGAVVEMPIGEAQDEGLLETTDLQRFSNQPLLFLLPEQNRFGRFDVGAEISPEYMALLLALVIYTSSFIAEIVRAGIQAVPPGQVEAARALGLSQAQTLSQIVLPQALRVIIPPLGNQYLNLSKNSSLGIGIGYAEMFMTSNTVMNQSGQTVTTFAIIMAFYLAVSLTISLVMNIVNQRFQLVTR